MTSCPSDPDTATTAQTTKAKYAVVMTSWCYDPYPNPVEFEYTVLCRRTTRTRAVKALERERKKAAQDWEEDEHYVELCYIEPNGNYRTFRADDYGNCPTEQIGECEQCQWQERPCHKRYSDGRCIELARQGIKWQVYRLYDPRSGETRYIGMTSKPLNKRLNGHLGAKGGKRGAWVQELKEAGLAPGIEAIDEFATLGEALDNESYLIAKLPNLTNGNGQAKICHDKATTEKIRNYQ